MKRSAKFTFGSCSICNEHRITFGQAESTQPGPRMQICEECWAHTLAWVQADDEKRKKIKVAFRKVKVSLAKALEVSDA